MRNAKRIVQASVLLLGIFICGCAQRYVAQRSTAELIELAADREQADRVRLEILEEISIRSLTAEQQRILGKRLAQVAKSPVHSPDIRRRTIDIIATQYPTEAPAWLSEALIETRESAIRIQILRYLEQWRDRRALPGLIVALSTKQADTCIPELRVGTPQAFRQAETSVEEVIVRITGDTLEEVLTSYLIGKEDDTLRVRNAALISLVRIIGREHAKRVLSSGGDVYLQPMCFWAEHFDYVPETRSDILMCQAQWLRLTAEQKTMLQHRVRLLQKREGYSFQIADSYLLLEVEESLLKTPGDALVRMIDKDMRILGHTKRPASYPGAADDYREDFIGQENRLSYTDVLRIRLVLLALQSETFLGQLYRYIGADYLDVETEVGGLSFLKEGTVELKVYPPSRKLGDNQYHESPEMITEGTFCLTRWHCHVDPYQEKAAQSDGVQGRYVQDEHKRSYNSGNWKGAALAGPGVDDMEYVKYFGCPLLVVTYLDRDILNVDYVSAKGIVIDLGNYILKPSEISRFQPL